MKKVLAVTALVGVAGAATIADAAPSPATLVSVTNYSNNGSGSFNLSLSTATWTFDSATGEAVITGGTYVGEVLSPNVYGHTMTGVTLGNFVPTLGTWSCQEGTFGSAVGASLCGNYNFGSNKINESTYTPSAQGATVVLGGDDSLLPPPNSGPPQTLQTSYSTMTTTSLGGDQYILSNAAFPGSTASKAGYDFLFELAPVVPDDTVPDAFSFTDQTGVALSTPITSNAITVAGINVPVAITAVGATTEYSIDGGAFTNAAGTVSAGQTVAVRVTSADTPATATPSGVVIGGLAGAFNVTTEAADTTPDAFSFTEQTDVAVSTPITSNAITVTGINALAPISVVGGEYSIGAGAFTSAPGAVSAGNVVSIRLTSSATPATATDATVTIGGVPGTFTVTTVMIEAQDDAVTAPINTPVSIAVLANDVGFGNPVVVGIYSIPSHGTVVVTGSPGNQSGISVNYTPSPGFLGIDTFQYTVDDNTSVGIATVTVQVILDPDGDGISKEEDNCSAVANPDQRDSNADGFGNLCDGDLDNNGFVNFADLSIFRQRFGSTDPDANLNGIGLVNFSDLAIFKSLFGKPPGPSGLVP